MQIAIAKRAQYNNLHCGDQCGYWQSGGKTTLCVVDGLGHGKHAERAAKAAVDYVAHHLSEPLPDIFAGCNRALADTRGAATIGIAVIDKDTGTLTYAGVGNTRAMIVGEKTVQLKSDWGIMGSGYKNLSAETVTLMPGDLVIMYTNGMAERIDMSDYDKALRADVSRLSEKILKDWRHKTDDVAILIFRNQVR